MRIVFAGTPDFAVPTLEALAAQPEHRLVAVLTNPDAPGKRGKLLLPSPVKSRLIRLEPDIPLIQAPKLDAEVRDQIAALSPDLLVCAAYGKIFGPKFLALFPFGGLNVHPSLLPELRGASPIQTALLQGLRQSGISVQKLALEMDAGNVLVQEIREISPDDDAGTLLERWAKEGAELVLQAIQRLENGETGREQDHGKASYCSRFEKDDARVRWSLSAAQIRNLVRACAAGPVAHTKLGQQQLLLHSVELVEDSALPVPAAPGQVVLVDKREGILIQTGKGLIRPLRLQVQGKSILGWRDFLNGVRHLQGIILGEGLN